MKPTGVGKGAVKTITGIDLDDQKLAEALKFVEEDPTGAADVAGEPFVEAAKDCLKAAAEQ